MVFKNQRLKFSTEYLVNAGTPRSPDPPLRVSAHYLSTTTTTINISFRKPYLSPVLKSLTLPTLLWFGVSLFPSPLHSSFPPTYFPLLLFSVIFPSLLHSIPSVTLFSAIHSLSVDSHRSVEDPWCRTCFPLYSQSRPFKWFGRTNILPFTLPTPKVFTGRRTYSVCVVGGYSSNSKDNKVSLFSVPPSPLEYNYSQGSHNPCGYSLHCDPGLT